MPYNDLKKLTERFYGPALALRRVFPGEVRARVQRIFMFVSILLFALMVLSLAFGQGALKGMPVVAFIVSLGARFAGAFFVVFPFAFAVSALEAFHRSFYFRGLEQVLAESTDRQHGPAASWEVATLVDDSAESDLVRGFLESEFGQEIMYRAGIGEDEFGEFFKNRVQPLPAAACVIERDQGVTLATYTRSIYKQNQELQHFLLQHNISAAQFVHAAEWVTNIERGERRSARWWSRDNLGRIPGLGKSWSYGETYLLEKYGHDLADDRAWVPALLTRHAEDDEVEEIEKVLARARQSNALITGEDTETIRQRVAQFYHKIREGNVLPMLEGKRVFMVDLPTIVAAGGDKAGFEALLIRVLNQAVHAGNIILYFEQVPAAIGSAQALGSDLVDIMLPYFESDAIQMLFAADTMSFHATLSRDVRIMQAFDQVQMHSVSMEGLRYLLEQRAMTRERYTGVVVTVPALEAIARMADRYFPTGVMPDKAFDLLEELVPLAMAKGINQLKQRDVEELVMEKTGIPMGEPTQAERQKLLSLEDFLHRRVVGQSEAVNAVSRALRRARAGVGSANKPMGSFLFLGPTGVGKTETAKALAEALFGSERMMSRLDMSEFQGEDALAELLGSVEGNRPGRLVTMIREKQYGVLLLDEFEKSARGVHDLFLQILDEGIFTDTAGKSVNARNLIIIATSNAGADLIWQWAKEGKDIAALKRTLIDTLIARSLFRPEFLNRFDDIIMFHPLASEQVRDIARIQLTNLAKHIAEERNIELVVTDELVDQVAEAGYDPQFGGRPLQRAIKERVEQLIADEMLKGELHPGDKLEYHG